LILLSNDETASTDAVVKWVLAKSVSP
jgi:hypothetical protein